MRISLAFASMPLVLACTPASTKLPSSDAPTAHAEHGHADHAHGEHAHGEHAHGPGAHGMPHRFEHADEWAKRFDDPSRDAWQKPDAVVGMLGLAASAIVADVGAGTGYFSVRLARAVPQGKVLASDIEPDMVRYLGERATREQLGNLVAVQGKPESPQLPEPADVILLVDVVHHIGHGADDRVAYFTRLQQQLREGGRIAIVDFKPDAPDDAPGPPKAHRSAAATMVAELAQAGFVEHARDEQTLPYQYVLQFVRAR